MRSTETTTRMVQGATKNSRTPVRKMKKAWTTPLGPTERNPGWNRLKKTPNSLGRLFPDPRTGKVRQKRASIHTLSANQTPKMTSGTLSRE